MDDESALHRFRDRILKHQRERGWTNSDLAKYTGLKRQTLFYVLNYSKEIPQLSTLQSFARAFDTTVDELAR
jgi:DNA-binding XRE family transcriptional regulator